MSGPAGIVVRRAEQQVGYVIPIHIPNGERDTRLEFVFCRVFDRDRLSAKGLEVDDDGLPLVGVPDCEVQTPIVIEVSCSYTNTNAVGPRDQTLLRIAEARGAPEWCHQHPEIPALISLAPGKQISHRVAVNVLYQQDGPRLRTAAL